jgi:hypothetical protein
MRILRLGQSLCSSNKVGGLTPIELIVNAFKDRVMKDGGVFEAQACLEAQLTILSNIG